MPTYPRVKAKNDATDNAGAFAPIVGSTAYAWPLTPTAKTTTHTASAWEFVLADATSAGFTVNLPASPSAGQQVGVIKTDSSVNTVTVAATGKTINGDATASIVSRWAGCVFQYDGANWFLASTLGGGSTALVSGTIIAQTAYDLGAGVDTTSSTFADVSTANLAVTFVAPSSKVNVRLEGNASISQNTTTYEWNLRDGSGDVAGTARKVMYNGTAQVRLGVTIPVVGLTPGNSYTYKWGHARTFGAGTCSMNPTPMLMTVTAVV